MLTQDEVNELKAIMDRILESQAAATTADIALAEAAEQLAGATVAHGAAVTQEAATQAALDSEVAAFREKVDSFLAS